MKITYSTIPHLYKDLDHSIMKGDSITNTLSLMMTHYDLLAQVETYNNIRSAEFQGETFNPTTNTAELADNIRSQQDTVSVVYFFKTPTSKQIASKLEICPDDFQRHSI